MGIRRRAVEKWLPVTLFLALILIGFLTSADYGQPWDEPWEQDILRMNYNQYAMFFGSEKRLTLLSDIEIPESGLIEDSIEKDHGVSAYYPVFFLVTESGMSVSTRMVLWHAYTWLWFIAGAVALYFLARQFSLSVLWSMAAVLFLMLTPRFFAQGHYNNKDMVLLSLVLILLSLTFRLLRKPTYPVAAVFALTGAVAVNTKIIGLPVYGLCFLVMWVPMLAHSEKRSRAWWTLGVSAIGFLLFFLLLTPAAWSDPLSYLAYTVQNAVGFSRWDHLVLFRGAVFYLAETRLPFFYLPYLILTTTPIWLLCLMGIGQGYAVHDLIRHRRLSTPNSVAAMLILLTLMWSVPLAYVIIARPILYNGWRHFFFLAAPLLGLAAYGVKRVWDALRTHHKPILKYGFIGLLAFVMAWTAGGMVLSHPAQYAYYNLLLTGRELPQYMELDYWNVSVLQTLRAFAGDIGEPTTIAGADYWSQAGLTSAYGLLSSEEQARLTVLPQNDPGAAYVLSNPTYRNFSSWEPDGSTLSAQTESYGYPICEIYAQTGDTPIE